MLLIKIACAAQSSCYNYITMSEFEGLAELFGEGEEGFEISELGEETAGLDDAEIEALDTADEAAEEQFQEFDEETMAEINENTPEEERAEIEETIEEADVDDLSDDQKEMAEGEEKDPEEPNKNLKTRLSKIWDQYGSFLKSVGKFAVKAVGEYFKWTFIIQVVKTAQTDIAKLIKILDEGPKAGPSDKNRMILLTNFLKFLTQVDQITDKIDKPLKIVTGAPTTTDPNGLANLFSNYFSLRASEELIGTATVLLKTGITVKTNNYYAHKALGLPSNATSDDLNKLPKTTILAAIAKLNVSDLNAFTDAALKHKEMLDKTLKTLGSSNDAGVNKLKASLTLPPNYVETFTDLKTLVSSNKKKPVKVTLPSFLALGTSPGPLLGDAVLSKSKSNFHETQKQLKDVIADYKHHVTFNGLDVSNMHVKITKVLFIVGHLKNQPDLKLSKVNLSDFNDTGWKTAEIITDIANHVVNQISLVLPQPLGSIAAINIPAVSDVKKMKDGKETDNYNISTEAMKHDITNVVFNLSDAKKQQARINTERESLAHFEEVLIIYEILLLYLKKGRSLKNA